MNGAEARAGFEVPGYVLGERIGAGGFGEVFRARHALMGRDVAIKILHAKYTAESEAVARFVAEARAVAKISHPGIVDVFDFGHLADGRQYCVMELVKGQTLRDLLRERTRLPLAEALPILAAIAEAVDAAHGAGVAHRDLKPDNVFVLADGSIKLIDFGLAKLTSEDTPAVTETGAVFGTPLYMSPEQCRGKAVDLRTDAYSFGVLAYHVLTGAPPFTGEALEIALHHLNDPPEPPSARCAELDERVDRVVLALLAKDPAQRPSPLAAAIDAIRGEAALPPPPPRPRRIWPLVAAGLAVTAGIAVFAIARIRKEPAAAVASCTPAAQKLAGIWDDGVRARLGGALGTGTRADIPGTWAAIAADLDDYSAAWTAQWDAACKAPDDDPVLRAQRTGCLDTALVDLRGITAFLATAKAEDLAASWSGTWLHPSLADCANEAALRAMPEPPATAQAAIAPLVLEYHHARDELRHGFAGLPADIDAALAKLDAIAQKLEAQHSTYANTAWWFRANALVVMTEGDPLRRVAARDAIDTAIRHADASRDDRWAAMDLAVLARLERGGGALDAADAAIARADAAVVRSGGAEAATRLVGIIHAEIDAAHGHLAQALARLDHLPAEDSAGLRDIPAHRAGLLRRTGKRAEAVELSRAERARTAKSLGEQHWLTARQSMYLARSLADAGDPAGALAELDRARAIGIALAVPHGRIRGLDLTRLDLAARIPRPDLLEQLAALSLSDDGVIHPMKPDEWWLVTQAAIDRGAIETARLTVQRFPREGGTLSPVFAEMRAIIAAVDGDLETLDRNSHELARPLTPTSSPNEARVSIWLRGLIEVKRGQRAAAEARLARLAPAHDMADPAIAGRSRTNDAIVLIALERWRDAVASLQGVRASPVWARNHQLATIDAWLGMALAGAGDEHKAIAPLEEALDILDDCCWGFSWITPTTELALARALWNTGTDRVRARTLAEAARDHFARGGHGGEILFKDQSRDAAIAWLATHTAADAAVPVAKVSSGCPVPANPKAPGKHVVYLATEGLRLTRGFINDAKTNVTSVINIDVYDAPPFLDGVADREAKIAEIVKTAQERLAPYSIDIVRTRPTTGDYRMVVLGGNPAMVRAQPGSLSVTPFDCSASSHGSIDLMFDAGDKMPATDYARTLLSDLGAMLGLAGVGRPGDCMCRTSGCVAKPGEVCDFTEGSIKLAFTQCGRMEQDERAMLKDALGCR